MSSFGFLDVLFSCQSISNSVAIFMKSDDRSLLPSKTTRMKNLSVEESLNCADSVMLQLFLSKKPLTAATMPFLSGQDNVSMYFSLIYM